MPLPSGFQRALLKLDDGTEIPCWFNPTQYAITKKNNWTMEKNVGSSLPTPQFGGGDARTMSLDLLFDAEPGYDVRGVADALFAMMEPDPGQATGRRNQGSPRYVQLTWGTYVGFWAVCTSLTVTFVRFRPDGTPIRARVGLSLTQVERDERSDAGTPAAVGQNPTTRSEERVRSHRVSDGDTLQSIAHRHLGDPTRWREIAVRNAVDDPMRLRPGQELEVPLVSS